MWNYIIKSVWTYNFRAIYSRDLVFSSLHDLQRVLLSYSQQLYQIQQVTMPAGQELTQPMFIQSTSQTADAQVTQVSAE